MCHGMGGEILGFLTRSGQKDGKVAMRELDTQNAR